MNEVRGFFTTFSARTEIQNSALNVVWVISFISLYKINLANIAKVTWKWLKTNNNEFTPVLIFNLQISDITEPACHRSFFYWGGGLGKSGVVYLAMIRVITAKGL